MAKQAIAYIKTKSGNASYATKQLDAIKAYCESADIKLADILYEDDADFHKELDERPVGRNLMERCKEQKAFNVVTVALWTAFKDTVDAARIIKSWKRKRIKLHLVSLKGEPFVNIGEAGALLGRLMADLKKLENYNKGVRIQQGQMNRKARGYVYGQTPYGYDRDGSRLFVNKDEQEVIKRIKSLHESGVSMNKIASILNGENIPTKKGKQWYRSTVDRILQSDPEERMPPLRKS